VDLSARGQIVEPKVKLHIERPTRGLGGETQMEVFMTTQKSSTVFNSNKTYGDAVRDDAPTFEWNECFALPLPPEAERRPLSLRTATGQRRRRRRHSRASMASRRWRSASRTFTTATSMSW